MFHTRSGNWTTLEYVFDYSYKDLRLFKLREFSGRNNKMGGEMCKIRETPGSVGQV